MPLSLPQSPENINGGPGGPILGIDRLEGPPFRMSTLVEHFEKEGWVPYRPGETVHCPSFETVRRDDRRGGALDARQIERRGSPQKLSSKVVPSDSERRRLVWPGGSAPAGAPFQRSCRAVIVESVGDTTTFIRLVAVDRAGERPRYVFTGPISGASQHIKICPDCGLLLELLSFPAAVLRAS